MSDTKTIEALKLINDWAKWLITIETGAIALIGSLFTSNKVRGLYLEKVFGMLAVSCFVVSIIAAALLLWTLPEIAQRLKPDENIWMTKDSIAKQLFRLNTQGFAILESLFFILGILSLAALILTVIWSK